MLELPNMNEINMVVIGDSMLDIYNDVIVERISPEAPIPILKYITGSSKYSLGGAANVALNLRNLGCNVTLFLLKSTKAQKESLVNNLFDHYYITFIEMLQKYGINFNKFEEDIYHIPIKSRFICNKQQIIRFDEEEIKPIKEETEKNIISKLKEINNVDGVIISDYGKGIITPNLCQAIISYCNALEVPVFVDPKGSEWGKYEGATCITPNMKEFESLCNIKSSDFNNRKKEIIHQAKMIISDFALNHLLITLGEKGMILISADETQKSLYMPTEALNVFDVSGAGDTVISVFGALYSTYATYNIDFNFNDFLRTSNIAAKIVIGKHGTCPITLKELNNEIDKINNKKYSSFNKIKSYLDFIDQISSWKLEGHKIVFTNGCFDIIHSGHIKLLNEASKYGKLIVALNSDASIKMIKGNDRPIIKQFDRAFVLANIEVVDLIYIFYDKTPINLINTIKPDYLIKGSDYEIDDIVGKTLVENYNGIVKTIQIEDDYSTTKIIEQIKNTHLRALVNKIDGEI